MSESTQESKKCKKVFNTMVSLLGLEANVNDSFDGKNVSLQVKTEEPGRLIGRNGSSLESLGLIMNRILKKNNREFPRVIIDVDGYEKKKPSNRKKEGNKDNKRQKTRKNADNNEASDNGYVAPETTVSASESQIFKVEEPATIVETPLQQAPEPPVKTPNKVVTSPAEEQPIPHKEKNTDDANKSKDKLKLQARNASKEVKKWGEEILLPPMNDEDCDRIINYFYEDKEVTAEVDSNQGQGNKKRVRVSLA